MNISSEKNIMECKHAQILPGAYHQGRYFWSMLSLLTEGPTFPVKSGIYPHCEGKSSEDVNYTKEKKHKKSYRVIQLLHCNSILLRPYDPKLIQKVVIYPVRIECALKFSEFGKYFTQLPMVESKKNILFICESNQFQHLENTFLQLCFCLSANHLRF